MKQYSFASVSLKTAVVHTITILYGRFSFFCTIDWVNRPEKKRLSWALGIVLASVVLMSMLGALSAIGVLPAAG